MEKQSFFSAKKRNELANYIERYFDENERSLDEYIIENISNISSNVDLPEDYLIDLFDFRSPKNQIESFAQNHLLPKIKQSSPPRITLTVNGAYWTIASLFNRNIPFKQKIVTALDHLSALPSNRKGNYYEDFCTLFLADLGFRAKRTGLKEDFGIDIYADLNLALNSTPLLAASPFSQSRVLLLAQSKCENTPIHLPRVRQLISDSLFYTFKGSSYCQLDLMSPLILAFFSHCGFSANATLFAKEHGIYLFSSQTIADILSCCDSPSSLQSIAYLNELLVDPVI